MPQVLDQIAELDFPVEDVCCHMCDQTATYRLIFHNCNRELSCRDCVVQLVDEVTRYKGIFCIKCERNFFPSLSFFEAQPL